MANPSKPVGESGNTTQRNSENSTDANSANRSSTRTASANRTGLARDASARVDRGNPTASGKTAKQEGQAETAIRVETEVSTESPQPPKAEQTDLFGNKVKADDKPKRGRKPATRREPLSTAQAQAQAQGLIGIVETFAVAKLGLSGQFTDPERAFIEPALTHLIEKYGAIGQQFGWIIDPLMLGAGLLMYASRVAPALTAQAQATEPAQAQATEPAQAQATEPPNGKPVDMSKIFGATGGVRSAF